MDIFETRNSTKSLLRSGDVSTERYQEALPLCKYLWQHYSETNNLWDVHQYINCLKKLSMIDEAEGICKVIYERYRDTQIQENNAKAYKYIINLYAWIIYEKYIKEIKQPEYQFENELICKTLLLTEIIDQGESNTPNLDFCVLQVVNKIKDKGNCDDILMILNKLEPEKISSEVQIYIDSNGKKREVASLKERYYQYKSDILLRLKKFEECIICCLEAQESIERLHYNNDVWFERKIVIALGEMGDIDNAIEKLKNLTKKCDKWFLFYEIAKLYFKQAKYTDYLFYMLRAAVTNDPEKMKVSLIEDIGDYFIFTNEEEIGQKHFLIAKKIREENGWFVKDKLKSKINKELEISYKELRKIWIAKLYDIAISKEGKIIKIFPNGAGGYINSDQVYYFQYKNFFGRRDKSNVGDVVKFVLIDSFDKKKNIETKEAFAITPITSNKRIQRN